MRNLYITLLVLFTFTTIHGQDTFRGTVETADGNPVQRALVQIYDDQEALLFSEFTDENGRFITDITAAGQVTSIGDDLLPPYHLSHAYPNPLLNGPLKFAYRSATGEVPEMEFFTFSGRRIYPGKTILPGTYLFKAKFRASPENSYEGMFTVVNAQPFDVVLTNPSVEKEKVETNKTRTTGRSSVLNIVRVEIIRDGFITYNEQTDLSSLQNLDQTYPLSLAPAPQANFTINASAGQSVGDLVQFDASQSSGANGEELAYQWSFSDGSFGGGEAIPHIFSSTGSYEVTLTVIGAYGATNSITKNIAISAPQGPSGTAAIRGIVTDVAGNPLSGVQLSVPHMGTSFTSTDEGEIAFDGFTSGSPQQMVFSKEGYITEYYSLEVDASSRQSYFELTLVERQHALTLENVEFGATIVGKDGASVTLPVDGLVKNDGSLVTGDVEVFITPINIANEGELEAFPGEFRGINAEGRVPLILTYGTADYVFEQNGERLQLAPGKTAIIDLPVYVPADESGANLQVGDELPLWSYIESSGTWVLESAGEITSSSESPTGLVVSGEVGHFSWWNIDIAPNPYRPIPECKTPLNASGVPVLKIPENGSCFIKGKLQGGSGPRGNPSTPDCCRPLPVPPGIPIELSASAGNGLYRGSVVVNGAAGVEEIVVIPLERIAGYGVLAGRISPDTVFTSAIEEQGQIDAYTLNEEIGTTVLLGVDASDGSTLGGTVEIRDPDNIPVEKRSFSGNASATFILEIEKTGDYQVIVDGTENEPGAYTVTLSATSVLNLDTNTEGSLDVANQTVRYVVDLQEGQLILPTVASTISGRIIINVFDPSGNRIATQRGNSLIQTSVVRAAESGVYSIEVYGVDANSVGSYTLGLPELDPPTPVSVDGPLTQIDGEITVVGDRKYYSLTLEANSRRKFALHTPGTSTGNLVIRLPSDATPFYSRSTLQSVRTTNQNESSRWGITGLRTITEAGEYIIEVNSRALTPLANQTGVHEAFIIGPNEGTIQINSEVSGDLPAYFNQINGIDHYTFTAQEGDLLNVAYVDAIDGRNTLVLLDANGSGVASIRDGQELGVRQLSAGTYTIELSGVDRGRSQGTYTIGLTTAEPPVPITKESPFVTVEGTVDLVGRKRYFSIDLATNERINVGLTSGSTLQSSLEFKRVSTDPFYSRQNFTSISAGSGQSRETRVFSSPENGEVILELDPVEGGSPKGDFRIYVGQRDIIPASLNTVITGEFTRDLGVFQQFERYQITAPASNAISVEFTWDNPDTFADRIYITVLDEAGVIIYRRREFNSSVINLPAAGDYIVEIESVDSPNDTYNLIINEE